MKPFAFKRPAENIPTVKYVGVRSQISRIGGVTVVGEKACMENVMPDVARLANISTRITDSGNW
jgi:hypothetical protein